MNKITPKRLQGFNELPPMHQLKFDQMINDIKTVFESYSFVPLDTPVLEYSDVLLAKSGGDIDKEIYRFTKGSTDICMRYDFTVPLARYVSMNYNDLIFPFKRYQIGKNYRGEKPQKGRFREFYQCDADIIGDGDLPLICDAECIQLYPACFKKWGFETIVSISNRKILNGIIEDINQTDKTNEILTLLDKIDKIGLEKLKLCLLDLNIDSISIDKLLEICNTKGEAKTIYNRLINLCSKENYINGLNELLEIDKYLKAYGLNDNEYIFDLSIIRGHNYYTGTVFEVYLKGHRELGAIGAGGRYDNLAEYYTDKKLPGVGMSIGLSRLFNLFVEKELIKIDNKTIADVAIIPMGETLLDCISISKKLVENDLKVDIFYENKSFKNKMKEANKKGTSFIIVVGENEIQTQKYSLKNMLTGEQKLLTINEICMEIKNQKSY